LVPEPRDVGEAHDGFRNLGRGSSRRRRTGLYALDQLHSNIDEIYDRHLLPVQTMTQLRAQTRQARVNLLQHLQESDPKALEKAATAIRDTQDQVKKLTDELLAVGLRPSHRTQAVPGGRPCAL
jgi:hypothetical protein